MLFVCSGCCSVENSAYSATFLRPGPSFCSRCETGEWHGVFARIRYHPDRHPRMKAVPEMFTLTCRAPHPLGHRPLHGSALFVGATPQEPTGRVLRGKDVEMLPGMSYAWCKGCRAWSEYRPLPPDPP